MHYVTCFRRTIIIKHIVKLSIAKIVLSGGTKRSRRIGTVNEELIIAYVHQVREY